MTGLNETYLVSTDWLAKHLGSPGLAIVDASWHLPATGRNGAEEFLAQHIPHAVHFDIDAIADTTTNLPHMLPDAIAFSAAVRKLGIGDGMKIVVYDSVGLFSAPARLVDFSSLRRARRGDPGRRPAQMARGKPARGGRPGPAAVAPFHRPNRPPADRLDDRHARGLQQRRRADRRRPLRRPLPGRRNRAAPRPALRPYSRAPATCPGPNWCKTDGCALPPNWRRPSPRPA